jgi:uncharacterized protein YbjQ (UPF0145 family)
MFPPHNPKRQIGREIAMKEMADKARAPDANAVVGVDLDFETLRDGMMMCIATERR